MKKSSNYYSTFWPKMSKNYLWERTKERRIVCRARGPLRDSGQDLKGSLIRNEIKEKIEEA